MKLIRISFNKLTEDAVLPVKASPTHSGLICLLTNIH